MIRSRGWRVGVRFSFRAGWMGYYYSPYNKRLCLGILPFVTVWVLQPGGKAP